MTATLTLDEELDALLRRDPAALADPNPLYHRLRAEVPVHRRGEDGTFWLLTRHADVAFVLRDPRFTAER
jgi:cytochrome P450